MTNYDLTGCHIHLASTPRHIMSSIAIAANLPNAQHHLVIFDQSNTNCDFVKVVNSLLNKHSIFTSSLCLYKASVSGVNKRKHRNSIFSQLEQFINELTPTVIYIGNDRRIEFQYLAQLLEGQTHNVYVDEGTGSYNNFFGISKIKSFFDKYLDTRIKRLAYGNWFDRPEVLGASKWVHSSILSFPDLANFALAQKPLRLFEPKWLTHPYIKEMLALYADKLSINLDEITNITTLFVLPHSSFIESSSFNVENYKKHVAEHIQNQSEIVGIKYHPRQIADPLHFSTLKITEIPRHIPLEMFLPIMNIKHAYGDISSALMSIKWLSPNAQVVAEKYNNSDAAVNLLAMFEKIGIKQS